MSNAFLSLAAVTLIFGFAGTDVEGCLLVSLAGLLQATKPIPKSNEAAIIGRKIFFFILKFLSLLFKMFSHLEYNVKRASYSNAPK